MSLLGSFSIRVPHHFGDRERDPSLDSYPQVLSAMQIDLLVSFWEVTRDSGDGGLQTFGLEGPEVGRDSRAVFHLSALTLKEIGIGFGV